jgi:predicted Fe-Mo cluster-binding NifX family protein
MPYKIALTSSDGTAIDTHFGHAQIFHILEVNDSSGEWEFKGFRTLPPEFREVFSGCGGAEGGSCGAPAAVSGYVQAAGCVCKTPAGGPGCAHQDPRMRYVAGLLADCRYVLTARIGKKPHMLLQRAGITALEAPADIRFAVSKLHAYHLKYAHINKL